MAKSPGFERFAKLIILMAVLKCCWTESERAPQPTMTPTPQTMLTRNGGKERTLEPANKQKLTRDNQFSSRDYHVEKPVNHRLYNLGGGGAGGSKGSGGEEGGGSYKEEGRSPFIMDRITVPNREYYRRNPENKSEFNRRVTVDRWTVKETGRDEDYIRKTNREALIEKTTFRKDDSANGDLNNKKTYSRENGSSGFDRYRNEDGYPPQTHPSSLEGEEYLATAAGNRQKKIKQKNGPGAFVPFLPLSRERKPNIILILTDDQDVELGSLNFMPKTLRLLRDGGAEFRHAYVTTPMCCPSRSSLLTGMYVHNHNVFTNNENCSNVLWQQTHETRTFATYLSNAGYRTGYFGKYLNKYNGSYIPPGWREWGGLIMNSRYYNYSINLNGKKVKHGFDYHKDYYPDLIANDSITFLRQSKQYFSRKPVMLVVSFPAPHGPEDSAPQYSKMFFNVTTHHTPSYDYAPNPDKQWILQVTNKMQDIHKHFTDILMTKRLQTLQSVDSAVERIYQELKNIGELDNTYIIYTSDHGYHLGQFGLVKGKSFPFEFDVRVPFLVRGPGIEAGAVIDDIVLNIDLAPTFLDLAGVESPIHMDGRSIVRLLHHRANKSRRRLKWPDTFLIESSGRRELPETLQARRLKQEKLKAKEARLKERENVNGTDISERYSHRNSKHSVSKSEGEKRGKQRQKSRQEGYDGESVDEAENSEEDTTSSFNQEPHYHGLLISSDSDSQVDNKIPQLAQAVSQPIPKLARLALECQSPGLQSPCQPGQKWHCVIDGDRWRKYKCKFQKKCTCFTPNGFVYTGVYNEEGNRKLSFGKKRSNEFDLWSQISERVDSTTLLSIMSRSSKVMGRRKRDTSEEHISDVWDDLKHELIEAEETETALNTTFTLGQEPNASKCSVTVLGKVNCSRLVYNDLKTWKRSRDEIESKIRKLKNELEALKEIRKHLKEKRPDVLGGTVTEESDQRSTDSTPSGTTEEFKNEISSSENLTTEIAPEYTEPENETVYSTAATFVHLPETTTVPFTKRVLTTTNFPKTTQVAFSSKTETVEDVSRGSHKRGKFDNSEDGASNRIGGVLTVFRGRDKCICRPEGQDVSYKKEEKELAREAKRRLKEERLRKKERKMRKKAKLEKECLSEGMNCFMHDNEHWRTPPLWTEGPFCFCMNANNNTYSCLRTINATHNFLYCEFTTGFKTFYNLRIDPFEQLNRISTLTPDESRFLSSQLADMKACKGSKECSIASGRDNSGYNLVNINNNNNNNNNHHHHHRQHHQQRHAYNPTIKKELGL